MPTDPYAQFWSYLSKPQRDLLNEGRYLMNEVIRHQSYQFRDYSFLIFPFAKAYEGFLKQLFKDNKMISHLDYISDHLRLGKLLSPHLVERLGEHSLYTKIKVRSDKEMADRIWATWKIGRNEIFHYFPHNLKSVRFDEAQQLTNEIIETMEQAYQKLYKKPNVSTFNML